MSKRVLIAIAAIVVVIAVGTAMSVKRSVKGAASRDEPGVKPVPTAPAPTR